MSERGPPPPEMAVSEQQIAEALESLLRESRAFASFNDVVQQLESKLGGVSLNHRVDFIRNQIQHLLRLQAQHQNFVPHHHHPQDHFALHQTPNFQSAPPPHPPPNFTPHHAAEVYGFRPPPPQPQLSQPPPPLVMNSPTPTPAPATAPAKESAPPAKKRRGGPGGLNKLCGVSPELQTIVGQPTMPRTEIVKQLWAYIRKYNLQDPNNKRKIICNDDLRLVFETDCTDMFKMNKLLAKHITSLEPTKQTAQNKKPKIDVVESGTGTGTGTGTGSASDDPVPIVIISEALASFFGTDEREMSQAEVLRQMWEYIKVNQLEDPLNQTAIICDEKLQELLGCESISALGIPEILAQRCLRKKS